MEMAARIVSPVDQRLQQGKKAESPQMLQSLSSCWAAAFNYVKNEKRKTKNVWKSGFL